MSIVSLCPRCSYVMKLSLPSLKPHVPLIENTGKHILLNTIKLLKQDSLDLLKQALFNREQIHKGQEL